MQVLPRVGFGQAIKMGFKNYATFNGRSRRSEFWFFHLLHFFVSFGISLIRVLVTIIVQDDNNSIANIFNGLIGIYNLVVLIPNIALAVRRFHDIGKSGYYVLLGLIPIVGTIIVMYYSCIDSEVNSNEYGPSPKYNNPQDEPLNQNNGGSGEPVSPYPQPNQMSPQVTSNPQMPPPQEFDP